MRLEIGKITITDIQFAKESKIEKGVLYVNPDDLKPVVLEDDKIKDVVFDIAKPGEPQVKCDEMGTLIAERV